MLYLLNETTQHKWQKIGKLPYLLLFVLNLNLGVEQWAISLMTAFIAWVLHFPTSPDLPSKPSKTPPIFVSLNYHPAVSIYDDHEFKGLMRAIIMFKQQNLNPLLVGMARREDILNACFRLIWFD